MELPHEKRNEQPTGARPIEKNPHGMNRKARRAQASEDRRAERAVRRAIASLDALVKR